MWHVSSRSGVAPSRTAIHLLLTYLLTYLRNEDQFCTSETKTMTGHRKVDMDVSSMRECNLYDCRNITNDGSENVLVLPAGECS